jgi:hypothetical protein
MSQIIKVNPTPNNAERKHNGYCYPVGKSLKQTLFFQSKYKQFAFEYYKLKNPN